MIDEYFNDAIQSLTIDHEVFHIRLAKEPREAQTLLFTYLMSNFAL